MTGQRAGWLVTKCQMDTTNCLNDFSLTFNWPQLWLSSLALRAVLRSAVGSPLGVHPRGSVQAPVSMTVPEGAVGFLVMPSSKNFASFMVWNVHGTISFHPPLLFSFFFLSSFSWQLLWSVTERHFLILVRYCWYFPPYAILTLVSRAIVKMPLCAQNRRL